MTLDELNQHFNSIQRLAEARELLQSLRSAACPGAGLPTGMPHAPGIQDRAGNLAAEIVDMYASVESLEHEVDAKESAIAQFIESIEDNQTRLIFRLRFLRGLAWKDVAAIIGGGNTAESVKVVCYRFLRQ